MCVDSNEIVFTLFVQTRNISLQLQNVIICLDYG